MRARHLQQSLRSLRAHLPSIAGPSWVARRYTSRNDDALPRGRLACCSASQYRFASTSAPNNGSGRLHASRAGMDGFTDLAYNTAADEFLATVEEVVDGLELRTVEEISASGGVLTLETSKRGTFIINKQAPNMQLWLSSPISGPHHYDMVVVPSADGSNEKVEWHCDKNGHNLRVKLEEELSEALQATVSL